MLGGGSMTTFFDSFTDSVTVHVGVRFEFSRMFGPMFLDSEGEPLKEQPLPGSKKWEAFEEWNLLQQTLPAPTTD